VTPADEARFIALWQVSTETAAIAQAFSIPKGTAQSRAHRLQQQGKIQPRPKGGSYPRQKAQGRQPVALSERTEPAPVHTPVQRPVHNPVQNSAPPGAVHNTVHTPVDQPPASSDLSGVLNALVERLAAIEATLKQGGAWFDTGAGVCTRAGLCTGAGICTARRGTPETVSRRPEIGTLEYLHAPVDPAADRAGGRA
jgi:hypothetical protein